MLFSGKTISQVQDVHVLQQIFILSVKLLKTTTDGVVSKMSNEIYLKFDNCQFNKIFVDTSGVFDGFPKH